jgi:glycerophosphoryl diester phosphodiesterase
MSRISGPNPQFFFSLETTMTTIPTIQLAMFLLAAIGAVVLTSAQSEKKTKTLVAHRGASAYAPEHTLEAYRLALEQRADYVEQDLQITKDGVLVCLHDVTLERTTDVETIFPDRARTDVSPDQLPGAQPARHWYVSDFTLAEIKRLDAGSWFDARFKGARIPTFQEAIDAVRGRAGLYPETKAPEVYGSRGLDMERLLTAALKQNRLDKPDAKTPLIIQSFSPESLRKLRTRHQLSLPMTFLIHADPERQWLTEDGLRRVRAFAEGIGPNKMLIERQPELVRWAHAAGLSVTPYTFRSSQTGAYKDVGDEMRHFLFTFGVDAVFTDNPDRFPR